MPISHGRSEDVGRKSTPPPAEAIGGRTSLCAAWSILLEFHRSPRRVTCVPLRFDWLQSIRAPLPVKVASYARSPFCCPSWNGNPVNLPSICKEWTLPLGSASVRRRPRELSELSFRRTIPYVASDVSLGTGHITRGINFTPRVFPVVAEATELYCFSTPARQNQCIRRIP